MGSTDTSVERLCAKFYAKKMGRPGLTPGVNFRLLLLGFFEGIDSERGKQISTGAQHYMAAGNREKVEGRRAHGRLLATA
jgi:hypothetical protein